MRRPTSSRWRTTPLRRAGSRARRRGRRTLDADTVASEGSWDAATAAAGAVLDGVDFAFGDGPRRSFCAVRPPGHHALRAAAMGFCLFGNVAIGAHYARAHGAERVLIVDWDVHHGNGTQALVEHERDIHFVSMHQWPWYPGTGAADDRGPHRQRLERPDAGGPSAGRLRDALRRAIDAATAGFVPDLVMISAGFDSLQGDPLGAFTLEYEHIESSRGSSSSAQSRGVAVESSVRSRVVTRRSGSAVPVFDT